MEKPKLISGIISIIIIAWAIYSFEYDGKEIVFHLILPVLFPVALIWYPKEINEFTLGLYGEGATINAPTPAFLISGFGWLILLGLSISIIFF